MKTFFPFSSSHRRHSSFIGSRPPLATRHPPFPSHPASCCCPGSSFPPHSLSSALALELKLSVPRPSLRFLFRCTCSSPTLPRGSTFWCTACSRRLHFLLDLFFLSYVRKMPSWSVYNKDFRVLSPLGSPQPVDSARLVPFERLFLYHCFSFRYYLHSLDGIRNMNASYRLHEVSSLHTRFPSASGRFAGSCLQFHFPAVIFLIALFSFALFLPLLWL